MLHYQLFINTLIKEYFLQQQLLWYNREWWREKGVDNERHRSAVTKTTRLQSYFWWSKPDNGWTEREFFPLHVSSCSVSNQLLSHWLCHSSNLRETKQKLSRLSQATIFKLHLQVECYLVPALKKAASLCVTRSVSWQRSRALRQDEMHVLWGAFKSNESQQKSERH